MRTAIVLGALLAGGCATTDRAPAPLAGRFGGDQAELLIDDAGGGRVILPCAAAAFEGPVMLDAGGHWLKAGTFTQGSGAPPPEPPQPQPANISGRLDRDGSLWLSIATRGGLVVNNARLYRDRATTIAFCP